MDQGFERLSADMGDGGGGGGGPTDGGATGAATDASGAAPTSAAPSAPAAAAQPQQPQGPDWAGLGGYDEVKADREYANQLRQRYSDPAWAQKYDALFQEQKAQAGHPYDWMVGDEQRMAALQEKGEQHPDFPRLQAEFGNFFRNPIGAISQYVTHPKVAEALLPALLPQIQDLATRIAEQKVGPLQQFVQQQGQQQFRQQYEQAFLALPDHIKQAHQQGIFGQGPQGIIGAIKFAKMSPQQQAEAAGGAPGAPTNDNRNAAVNKDGKPASVAGRTPKDKKDDDDLDEYAKKLHAAGQKK